MAIIVKSPSWNTIQEATWSLSSPEEPKPQSEKKISTDTSVNPCILMHGRCVIELGERRFVTPRAFTVEKNSRRWNSQGGGTRRRWNSQGHGTLRRRKSLKSGTPRGWNCSCAYTSTFKRLQNDRWEPLNYGKNACMLLEPWKRCNMTFLGPSGPIFYIDIDMY